MQGRIGVSQSIVAGINNHLAAPTHSHNTPLLNLASSLGFNILDYSGNGTNSLRGSSDALEESTKFGAFLGRVRGKVGRGKWLAVEEVRDVDLVTGMGEHVSTLGEGISAKDTLSGRRWLDVHTWSTESEDVEDVKNGGGGIFGTGLVYGRGT